MDNQVYVYLIQLGNNRFKGPVKIGIASDPGSRLSDLQVANPYQLKLRRVYAFDCRADAQVVEAELHRHYHLLRVRGEWFKPDFTDDDIAATIDIILTGKHFKRATEAAALGQPKSIRGRRKGYYRALMSYRRANPEVSNLESKKLLRKEWNL